MSKNIIKPVANVTVSGVKALGHGTQFVTDYTEVGLEKTVDGVKYLGRGLRVAGVKTKVGFKAHRVAKADRMAKREIARLERKAAKAAQEPDADLNEVKTQLKADVEGATA